MAYASCFNLAERALSEPTESQDIGLEPIRRAQEIEEPSITPAMTYETPLQESQSRVADEQQTSDNDDHGSYSDITWNKIHEHPKGIPQFAAFLTSAESFAIIRRYGWVNSRILVHLQLELNKLEKGLKDFDMQDSIHRTDLERPRHLVGSDELQEEHHDRLVAIKEKMLEYLDFTLKISQVHGLGRASARDHKSAMYWLQRNHPVFKTQHDFLSQGDDFVYLAPGTKKKTWFREKIEIAAETFPWLECVRFLKTEVEQTKADDKNIIYYSPTRLKIIECVIYVFIVAVLLLLPIILMTVRSMSKDIMAVMICCFVLAFEATICTVTDARPQDIFIGTAAYGAMLVAFVSNIN